MEAAATGRHDVLPCYRSLQSLNRRGRLGLPHGRRGWKTCGASGRPRPTDKVGANLIRCRIRQGLPLEGKLAREARLMRWRPARSALRADEDIGPYGGRCFPPVSTSSAPSGHLPLKGKALANPGRLVEDRADQCARPLFLSPCPGLFFSPEVCYTTPQRK